MNQAITITQLIIGFFSLLTAIGIPVAIGLFNIMKSINQTNTRLDHIEKNQDMANNGLAKIPTIESRIRSLEQTRSDQLPQHTQMLQMLSSLDAKLTMATERMIMFESKFDLKFTEYEKQRVAFFEKYSHVLNEKTK
jgi:MFS superfamily sulfate permease-like transporter